VNASKEAVQIKLEITKTGLVSTTNSDVINTLHQENNAQNTSISTGFSRGSQKNTGVTLTVQNLLQPSSSSSGIVPIYKRKEMLMKSNTNSKPSNMQQTHIPDKSNISSNIKMEKPGPSSSILGKHNAPTSSSKSIIKSDQPKKIRKNSKNLQVKVKRDPIKQKLIEMPDSCPSTPETPPTSKFQNNPITSLPSRPTVAELSSKFEKGSVSNT
jgi:hypothetical protein